MLVFFVLPVSLFIALVALWYTDASIKWIICIICLHFIIATILVSVFYNDLIQIRNYIASYVNSPPTPNRISLSVLSDCGLISDGIEFVVEQLDKKDDLLQVARVENEAVFNLVSSPVFIIDSSMNVLRLNKGAHLLLGIDVDNLETCNELVESSFLSELRIRISNMNNGVSIDGGRFECSILIKGAKNFFKVSVALFGTEERLNAKFVVVMTNVTSYKNLERSMSDFIANASHEIRTPLTSMVGFIETIKDIIKDDPKEVNRFLDIVIDQGSKVVNLLDSLLTLSRADFERSVSINEYVDLHTIIQESVLHCNYLLKEREIRVVVKKINHLARVKGDYYGLLQVCNNLIINAINHSYKGGIVEISCGMCMDAPFADVEYDQKFMFLQVSDFGQGMDSKHLSRISERFYKVNSSSIGSGLGLSIVKSVLERHKAKFKIESEKNKGSTFIVYLRDQQVKTMKDNKTTSSKTNITI
ncbi:hypothetical protein CAXC1_190002 [Candidatus Xenohaliotis californiensis]|uniref:histidine kinase n=2 Tax=Candidatus Xenohaliotis californiensis TaxID=84677 RepID=A0ABP0EVJ1_9RICK|nr:hypothetical protein CAXC1_190002 [Candidatus Xenohaliotis californiensis]